MLKLLVLRFSEEGGLIITYNELKLCGGVFFSLLLQARKQRHGAREHYSGLSDGLSEPSTLWGLIKVIFCDWPDPTSSTAATIKSATSNYKSCKACGSIYMPFSDDTIVDSFNDRILKDYHSQLLLMYKFTEKFIAFNDGSNKDSVLVKSVLKIISMDDSIDSEQYFFIKIDGSPVKKEDMLNLSEINLQSFLLGIWHFIVCLRKDNLVGKETYEFLFSTKNACGKENLANIAKTWNKPLILEYCDEFNSVEEIELDSKQDSSTAFQDEDMRSEHQEPPFVQQNVNNPIVFNFTQNGEKNVQIGHVDRYYNREKE